MWSRGEKVVTIIVQYVVRSKCLDWGRDGGSLWNIMVALQSDLVRTQKVHK